MIWRCCANDILSMMKFSILVPAYKSLYLSDCIDSILAQTYEDFELILVNDASPNPIDEIVNKYSDRRIKYYINAVGYGAENVVDNWNKCLSYAQGEYAICMGDDDMLYPDCLRNYLEIMIKYPNLDIYHARTDIVDANNRLIDLQEDRPEFESAYSLAWHGFRGRIQYIGDFCYKISSLRKNGGFYKFPLALSSDYVSALIAARSNGIANVRKASFIYRRNSSNISNMGNCKTLIEATDQVEAWYLTFLKETPHNEEDQKYRIMLKSMISPYFRHQKMDLLFRDMANDHLYRVLYWFKIRKKYGFKMMDIIRTMFKSCVWKIRNWASAPQYLLKKLIKRMIIGEGEDKVYIRKISASAPWVFISYIPYAFYIKKEKDLNVHQNLREMIAMADVFNKKGYNVYVMLYNTSKTLPDIDPAIVLGLEPLFEKACKKYVKAKKVYYATGGYYEHQNKMVTELTDKFNDFYHSQIPYRRIVRPHRSCVIADHILQIGSCFTIETYPLELQKKIALIHQSVQAINNLDEILYADANEFVFMGSSGNALKGLGVLVEYFCSDNQRTLHVIGPIENDVLVALRSRLTPNITFHGFMDVNSPDFQAIMRRCNFLIYPSGSEGCPGAVLNLMRYGMIPIVSRWASLDNIGELGYMLNDISSNSISESIDWASQLSKDQVIDMKKNASKYVEMNYSLEIFRNELGQFIDKLR